MFGLTLLVVRAFLIGFVVGVLVAPRAGAETRRKLLASLAPLTESLADLLGLPAEPGPLPEPFAREPAERAARA